jgi:hypothetical protein
MGILSGMQRRREMRPEGTWVVRKGTEIRIGQPRDYPSGLVTGLKMLFSSTGQVERAYLVEMYDPKSGEPPHSLIVIAMKTGSTKKFSDIVPEVGAVIKQAAKKGEPIDIMDLSTADTIGDHIAKSTAPFYP